MTFDDHYDFRSRLVDVVKRDLIGFSSPDEEIVDPPITRYAAGILFPRDSGVVEGSEDFEGEQGYDEYSSPDPPVAMANVRYPSSMGLTFSVDIDTASRIEVSMECGRYESQETDGGEVWRRIPIGPVRVTVDCSQATEGKREPVAEGLELFYRIRRPGSDRAASVTLVLLNTKTAPGRGKRDEFAFFQPEISVKALDSTCAPFVGRRTRRMTSDDADIRSYRLLYRYSTPIAIGHGCSVEWDRDADDQTRARTISTTFAPQYELLLSDSPRTRLPGLVMKELAEGRRSVTVDALEQFCDCYASWIGTEGEGNGLWSRVEEFEGELRDTASDHIEACEEALERMRRGVALLGADDLVWRSFQLANLAMLQQRARSEWLRSNRSTDGPVLSSDHAWRPFQLAFILVALSGIALEESAERDIADLLWFPTGGGKTEAYLGLIAFTVFLRRLRHGDSGGGVTVIMRYTLRLLTIQQFERAALLVCCCESLRRESGDLGGTPISIGLWVGEGGTPNKLSVARRSLNKIRQGQTLEKANPIQLHQCPWCGTPLTSSNYYITAHNPRLVITCRNESCEFEKELPVFVVDEDIYRHRPTLLIATADKFASLPWREEAAAIFNLQHRSEPPPELIVQDELHLISGPLGTLAGLYETAIDILCTSGGHRPKVIASTATIRRAASQARGLFDREVRQFPPPGIDAADSFFAVESPRAQKASRLYFGLMAPATSQATLLVRVYSALLQGAYELEGADAVRDAYWSLVGYFNSLRVLGGARMQVQDDVSEDRVPLLAEASGHDPRRIENRIELTSREPSGDIPSHLKRMEQYAFPHSEALDVILATNMISVGVDVDRLGLMAVMGQPQSTSEYIQATSRVGRKYPGLVCILFNGAKSRDRSHYEGFVDFHSALYRQVESTSVTPFSARSRDRGLHAVLIALARLTIDGLHSNQSANRAQEFVEQLNEIKNRILDRVGHVAEAERAATEAQLDEIINQWRRRIDENPDLAYADFNQTDRSLLVGAAETDVDPDQSFPTLWSLRDVDAASNLFHVT